MKLNWCDLGFSIMFDGVPKVDGRVIASQLISFGMTLVISFVEFFRLEGWYL